ncbi:hypothetical protein [Sphingomonas sp.]|jgi:hypothetical protein|uniref:hypothetical protein n=1 Tax=Sphingomonas sp. TaxID=28214 RepID=UPI002E37A821|nr:hypothetical protein [Sphingomonas sp.]HEX4693170.1 hypothetical protein [Sphingomonas sp.]
MPLHIAGSNSLAGIDAEWLEAIPPMSLSRVLDYVVATWRALVKEWPNQHCFSNSEPILSLSLGQRLNELKRKRKAGVSGAFLAEALEPVRDGGVVQQHGRTDIKFVLGDIGAPELIIECKKLDGTGAKRTLYCTEGIARFVSGKYAADYGHGVMLGFCRNSASQESTYLQNLLGTSAIVATCNSLPFGGGHFTLHPSEICPTLASFDTRHKRSDCVTPFQIAHLLLDAPELVGDGTPTSPPSLALQ